MEDVKLRLAEEIAARLSGAPDGAAKAELIEELSNNLYSRYLEMTEIGVEPDFAFQGAMDALGDTDELVDYLNSLAPDEPLPGPEEENPQSRVVINAGDTVIELEDLLKNVNVIVKSAVDAAKGAVKGAASAMKDVKKQMKQDGHYTYTSPGGRMRVDIQKDPPIVVGATIRKKVKDDADRAEEEAIRAEGEAIRAEGEALRAEAETMRAECERERAELEAEGEALRAEAETLRAECERERAELEKETAESAKEKDVIYGIGYDKAKGGWFAQWGEWKGGRPAQEDCPIHAEGAWVEHQPDDTYAVQGKLRAIDVEVGGDISIRMDETENDDVVIDGDIEDITVDVSADGKLTVRQRARTASAGFFFNRGLSTADVELTLPRRRWDSVRISTVSGDIEVEGDEPVNTLSIQTTNGDVSGCVGWCDQLSVHTASGDIEWRGGADRAVLASASGDVELEGHFESLEISSASGDVGLTGDCGVNHIKCSSMSGDIEVESDVLPLSMELFSKSGDIEARIPDSGPFSVQCRTMSGEIASGFFEGVVGSRRFSFSWGQTGELEDAPVYRMETVSGDISLERL